MSTMNELSALRERVIDYLAGQEGLAQAAIVPAWSAAAREFPLKKAAVAIGVDSVEVSPGGRGGYWGESAGQPLVGSGASVTLRFDLYSPQKAGGGPLHALYEALCAHLLAAACPFGLMRIWCGAPEWDKTALAYHMPVHATLRAALLGAGESLALNDFMLYRKGE